ncbi:MAG TPA: peptidylprolyl isomerase [Vibrio sp.]|nr:peptidylprolyl isomerase [Vibrio sp.]
MTKIIFPIVIFVLAGFFIYRTWTNHKAADVNFELGQAFLAENGVKEGVITTESGLQYLVLEKGEGTVHPTKSNKVKVHYHGTLLDGSVFDSSVDRGEPITFGLGQVIAGWQEGLTYMTVGDKVRLFVPSTLAYGKNGTGPIPPSATLIFDVELIDIQ